MNAALQLEEFFLTRLDVTCEPPSEEKQETGGQTSIGFDYDVANHIDEPLRRRMDFRFKLQEQTADQKPLGFRLTVEIVGFFTIGDQIPPEKVELQTRVNGVSVLYGILRGLVANVTGSFPVGKLVLPTVMPQDIVNDVERRKAEERNKEAAKLPHESIKSSEGI